MFYLDDLKPGTRFKSESLRVEKEDIKAFASRFDPQPFHLDSEEAKHSFFGELVASGWHTAALTMKLLVEGELKLAGGLIGTSAEVSWTRPVKPGDVLRVEGEIVEVTPSKSKSDRGTAIMKCLTLNQRDEVVQEFRAKLLVFRKPF